MLSARHAGVLGSPISHSLSPVLHRAAYAALGLRGWTYDAARVGADGLAAHLRGLGPEWVGLSLTMPLKEAALALAEEVTPLARSTGAVNTLVRRSAGPGADPAPDTWWGDNTDVHGLVAAVAEVGGGPVDHVVVVGSGATARSAVAAATAWGATRVTFMVRDRVRPETDRQARGAGLDVVVVPAGRWPDDVDVVVSTVPPASTTGWATTLPPAGADRRPGRAAPVVLDAVYGDGVTPLLSVAAASGWTVVPGTAMLLHQAARQVELMTGRPPPLEAMRAALAGALARRAP